MRSESPGSCWRASIGTTACSARRAPRAKERFDAGDWAGVQQAVKERIRFYDERVAEYVDRLSAEFAGQSLDDAVWQRAKLIYVGLLLDHKRPELAETFFNSVTTRVLRRAYIHDDLIFTRAAVSTEYIPADDPPTYRSYYPTEPGLRETFLRVFRDLDWTRGFDDLEPRRRPRHARGARADRQPASRRRTSRCRC